MDQPRSYSRYVLVALCIAVVFTALVLVALNAWMKQPGENMVFKGSGYTDGYRDGFNAAREKMKIVAGSDILEDATSSNGEVISVSSDRLVVKQTSLDTDPVVDGVDNERTVTLAKDAKG